MAEAAGMPRDRLRMMTDSCKVDIVTVPFSPAVNDAIPMVAGAVGFDQHWGVKAKRLPWKSKAALRAHGRLVTVDRQLPDTHRLESGSKCRRVAGAAADVSLPFPYVKLHHSRE